MPQPEAVTRFDLMHKLRDVQQVIGIVIASDGHARLALADDEARRFSHGQTVRAAQVPAGSCRVYAAAGGFLGLGRLGSDGMLAPLRLVANIEK